MSSSTPSQFLQYLNANRIVQNKSWHLSLRSAFFLKDIVTVWLSRLAQSWLLGFRNDTYIPAWPLLFNVVSCWVTLCGTSKPNASRTVILSLPVSHSYQWVNLHYIKRFVWVFPKFFSLYSFSVMSEGVAFLCVHLYKGLHEEFFFAKVMLRT